jgi:hypothetical protein
MAGDSMSAGGRRLHGIETDCDRRLRRQASMSANAVTSRFNAFVQSAWTTCRWGPVSSEHSGQIM